MGIRNRLISQVKHERGFRKQNPRYNGDNSIIVLLKMSSRMHLKIGSLAALLLAFACTTTPLPDASKGPAAAESIRSFPSNEGRTRDSYTSRAKNGMVTTSHELASAAGQQALKNGGNAVDAAVAASFAISVVRPQSTGIGGGGFLLLHINDSEPKAFDFRERAPRAAKRDMFLDAHGNPKNFTYGGQTLENASLNGHLSVGTPGLIKGLAEVHRRYGKLPWKDLVQPAIDLADKGFPVYKELEDAIKGRLKVLQTFPATKKIFLPDDKPLKVGDTLVQKDLAWTLKQVAAKGADGFYQGAVAERLISEMKQGKGILTREDLKTYEVKERLPVKGTYRGHKIVSMPPPSSGGVHLIEMLNMLEHYNLKELGFHSASSINRMAEAMRRAYADRARYLGDPDFVAVPVKGLMSKKYAAELIKSIHPDQASDSKTIGAGNPLPYESSSTTHISIVDKDGNAVATTQTINYTFGSGVVAAGTGVVLNDEMDDFAIAPDTPNAFGLVGGVANSVQARKTMLSSMTPTLVYNKDGALELIVGSPGGSRIINATLQTIINTIDYNMPLEDAVHAYRIHQQWQPDLLYVEPNGLPSETIESLKKMGYPVSFEREEIGDVQAIARDGDSWIGVSDTRSDGKPMGL